MRWLGNLTDRQYWWLVGGIGLTVAIGVGTGTVKLLDHFGWRAWPILLFLATGTATGAVVMLRMLRRLP